MPRCRPALLIIVVAALCAVASAQQQQQPPSPISGIAQPQQHTPPPITAVAAKVNDQTIPELAVFRGLIGVPDNKRAELRGEVLNYLIENALLDEYLDQMRIEVDAKELEEKVGKVKAEIAAKGQKLEEVYKELFITETDLRTQIRAALRWDKFIKQYATEKTLKEFFDGNKAIFDGSSMRASHILITVPPGNPQGTEEAKAKVAALKRQIENHVAEQLSKSGKLDNLDLQKLRITLLTETFAFLAEKESSCPTKGRGGDLGWFPHGGGRVAEPFAKAAFNLKQWELSDAVATEFGYHLILCIDYKAGVERKFEEIKEVVHDVYAGKMREAIIAQRKPAAKITISPVQK